MATRVSVALVKSLVFAEPGDVCIAIDVLRATTTLAVLLGRGATGVWLAADVDRARELGQQTKRLICGESGGLAPAGFDFGNSPIEFSRLDLTGREIVFATTNGTGTLRACASGSKVLAGAFVNATATVQSALRALGDGGRLLIACAGTHGRFGLEDAACAGFMVRAVCRARPDTAVDDAAEGARRLFESFGGAFEAVRASAHAHSLYDLGLGDDVAFCAQLDVTGVVPELAVAPGSTPWPLYLVD